MPTHCTPWKKEQRASGRSVVVRRCVDGSSAEIVDGENYYTYNLYRNGSLAHAWQHTNTEGSQASCPA